MNTPEVSVVMAVYNGAATLQRTLSSVLAQQNCNFEFIVINDGSSDDSGGMLDELAVIDGRLRVVHQPNTGLTKALMHGCNLAQGEFIARQDAGDISLPGRLEAQSIWLREHPDTVLICSTTRFTGPGDEFLFSVTRAGEQFANGLAQLELARIHGPPHHGSTMFRRAAYIKSGGYRPVFVVAQDIDLWLRLSELGSCWGMEDIHYQATLAADSISGRRRTEQVKACELAIMCAKQRRSGNSDSNLLSQVVAPEKPAKRGITGREKSRFHYFIGSCLRATDPVTAKKYFRRAVQDNPFAVRALLRWLLG